MSEPKPTAGDPARATPGFLWLRTGALLLAALLGLGVAGGALWGIRLLNALGSHPTVPLRDELAPVDIGGPRNILVLGNDTRKGLSKEEKEHFGSEQDVPDDRTDTMILMHLDPRRDKGVIVHFPRDLRVEIPGHGVDKINAAYEYGGPRLAIQTVERFSGLPIHNYIEISLAGFQNLVDTLGGVTICVDQPMYDELAGLDIPTAGCHDLDGDMALAYVRARQIEGDAIPDFSRIARQQQFMRAFVNKMLSLGSLLDAGLIQEAAQQVTTDDRLTGAELIYLASELRKVSQTDPSGASLVDFRAVPSRPAFIDGVAYVLAEQPETRELFRRLEGGRPLGGLGKVLVGTEISPANITAQVLQGGPATAAAAGTELLRQSGFIVLEPRPAPASMRRTMVLYARGDEEGADMAEVAAGFLPGVPVTGASPKVLGEADVVVVVGKDYRSFQP